MDKILVLKQVDGKLEVSAIKINDMSFIINEINDAVENPNKTLWDVQSLFFNNYQPKEDYYWYAYPYSYNSSYIPPSEKPKLYTNDEYKKELINAEDKKERERILKTCYADSCKRYIIQQEMHEAYRKAEQDSSVKMYSREDQGWNRFLYYITSDIKTEVSTNFCFGSASYFSLTISYKGIVIAPFAHVVRYYIANMTDIIFCTRNYLVSRESWEPAMVFVKEFVNQSLSNPERFVEEYLMNEIDEMMKGLRNIMDHPIDVINMFRNQRTNNLPEEYHRLRFIHPMSYDEDRLFYTFSREMPIVFMAEKLTQVTKTLNSLIEIGKVYAKVNDYVDEILGMITKLKPRVSDTIYNVSWDIKRLKDQKEQKERILKPLELRFEPYKRELNSILDNMPDSCKWQERDDARNRYEKDHPTYVSLKQQINDAKNDITTLNNKITSRESLVSRLKACVEQLKPYEEAA